MAGFQPMNSPATWFGQLSPAQKITVLKNVKIEGARRFSKYREVLKDSLGLQELRGDELLNAYRQRTPDVWENLQRNFPDTYESQMKEWGKLEDKAAQKQVLPPPPNPILSSPDAQSSPFTAPPQGVS